MSDEEDQRFTAVSGALDEVLGQVLDARTAIEDGHTLDLTGMDESVEIVCRAAGTLPKEDGKRLAPNLARLIQALDDLSDAVKRVRGDEPEDGSHH
ncbi:MAG: hypothetical protein Alpg2KO_11700 [Alphaproteobacteria bacterium]